MIQPVHDQTFEWIFDGDATARASSSSAINWLRSGDGIFWIKGKPGSGKSTLMKMLAGNDRTRQALSEWNGGSQPIFSSFFFWSQASGVENSELGLLRVMLHDVLVDRPILCEHAFPDWQPKHAVHEPTMIDASVAFNRLLSFSSLRDEILVLLDGLDEYGKDSIQRAKLAAMIDSFAKSTRIKFLVSGRPLQEFETALCRQPHLVIHHFTESCIRTGQRQAHAWRPFSLSRLLRRC